MTPLTPATLFRILSDETRLRCLMLLAGGELCVCDLTQALQLSQPKISKHLAVLREYGLAQTRRDGLWMYYRYHAELPAWALEILQAASRSGDPGLAEDQRRLRDLKQTESCCSI